MASIKVKFRPSTVAGHEGSIYYQIIHERKARQLLSPYRIYPDEWNERRATVTSGNMDTRKPAILAIRENILHDTERLNRIVRRLESSRAAYSADDLIEEFNRYTSECSFGNFMKTLSTRSGKMPG